MKNISDENLINKENEYPNDLNQKESNINNLKKDIQENIDNSFSSIKLKIKEHYEINSKENKIEKQISSIKKENDNQLEEDKKNFINDFYSEESEKNSPKTVDGKGVIDINEIIGEETKQPILLKMIDDKGVLLSPGKISAKSFGVISSYAANTNNGIIRDYNEDRVSVVINMNKPKYYSGMIPWPKISYFGVFDGHAGNKCAEFLRDNLINYICNNIYFPNDIPNAIKSGFKKIDEDYLRKHAYINNKLIDNSGSCGLILLLINNLIYIANVGDSRCIGSFKNGKIQKDITLDHKPNTPYEKERILKYGGRIYQTQTPIDDDESFKDKILMGPYRVFPGKLSVSRTVGDAEGKIEALGGNPNVIVPQPDIFCFDLLKDDIDFFILGCDGIYDQLCSKDVFKCAWMVLNNNLDLYRKRIFEKNIANNFKGNYGNEINMNTTSGNIVDLILKASMFRKSFDNVTCLFISFKNFFENLEKTLPINNSNENNNLISNQNRHFIAEKLLRNKSQNINKIESELIFKEKNHSEKSLTKETNNNNDNKLLNSKGDEEDKNKNSISNMKKIKSPYSSNKKKIRINSVPKQSLSIEKEKKIEEDNFRKINSNKNNNKLITDKNNNNNFLNNEYNSKSPINFFSDKIIINSNINIINSPIPKNNFNKTSNNLINSSNQIFFTKMQITGLNNKNRIKKELKNNNQIIRNNMNNKEENFRHTSYNKKIRPLFIDNTNDIGKFTDSIKKEKYYLIDNNNSKLNYKKINEAEYKKNFEKNEKFENKNNNIRSNSHNNDKKIYNIKPINIKNDKLQQKNNYYNYNFNQNELNNKFNNIKNILKTNSYGIINNKIGSPNIIVDNNLMSLKNITLTKLKNQKKNDEIKIRKPMPSIGGQLHLNKNNKIYEENNFVKQRRFITNDNVKRKSNLSEHKKLGNGSYKIELNLSNKNNTGIGSKLNNFFNNNINEDINVIQYDLIKNGFKKKHS